MARTIDFAKKLRKIAASLEELASAIESFPAGNGKDNVQNLSHFSKRAVSFTLKEERGHEGRERRQTDGASHQDR